MSRPIDLHDLSYLAEGTERQRQAREVIEELGLFDDLAAYTPALAGTIPLDIDIQSSDLDVICRATDLGEFNDRVRQLYDHFEAYGSNRSLVRGVDSVVAWFWHEGWSFELFAQDVPVAEQLACLHLMVEARLLALAGQPARAAIRELKRQGQKTEPAFARYFGLHGDPYEELARLALASDEALRAVVARRC